MLRVMQGEENISDGTTAETASIPRSTPEERTLTHVAAADSAANKTNDSRENKQQDGKDQNSKDEDEGSEVVTASAEEKGAAASADTATAEPVKRKRGRRRLIHDEEERKARRQMQCKLNQRRYRARQRGMITTLSLESEKASDSIHELEAYHRFLVDFDRERTFLQDSASRTTNLPATVQDRRPWMVVSHFVRLFRHGFALHSVELSEIQEQFLRFAMDAQLVSQGATHRGVDALILQLKRYSSYHAVFEIQTESVDVLHPHVVRVTGKLHLRISRDTVVLLYPHIIDDDELHARVVGHEIHPRFAMVFHFNDLAKVTKFELAVDFAMAFLPLTGSAARTSRLLEHAIVTPFAELGVDPHGAVGTRPSGGNKQLSLKFILL